MKMFISAEVETSEILNRLSDDQLIAELGKRGLSKSADAAKQFRKEFKPLTEALDDLESMLFRHDLQSALIEIERLRALDKPDETPTRYAYALREAETRRVSA